MMQGIYCLAYKVKYCVVFDVDNNLLAFYVWGVGVYGSLVFENCFFVGVVVYYLVEYYDLGFNIFIGVWWVFCFNFMAYVEQVFIDEIVEVIGQDFIDFCLQLFEKVQQLLVGENNDYDVVCYVGVLKLVKEKVGWGKFILGLYWGVLAYYCYNSYVVQVVDVEM